MSAPIDDVLVLVHERRPDAVAAAGPIVAWLEARGASVRREDSLLYSRARHGARIEGRPLRDAPTLLVVLGGDGTLLAAAQAFSHDPVPTVGVNFGHVGFLASTPASRWEETLASVFDGVARIEQRMRLEVFWTDRGETHSDVALNEVVLQRGSHQSMLRAAMWVGEDEVTTYRADGLILATPSGSTAYSLSAGGPILEPSLPGIVVTPIASQGLANRPLVLHAEHVIRVSVASPSGTTSLTVDGQTAYGLASGQEVRVQRHPVPYPLIALPDLDPYRRLRDRLGWGGGPTVFRNPLDDAEPGDPFPPTSPEGGCY
ncbi:MAG: NAD(+)/NADH kinase [Planctomycetota bacterium]